MKSKLSLSMFLFYCICLNVMISNSQKPTKEKTFLRAKNADPTSTQDSSKSGNQNVNINESASIKESNNAVQPNKHMGNCFMRINNWFYNINPVTPEGHDLSIRTIAGENIDFNLCHDLSTFCTGTDQKGMIVDKDKCNHFASKSSEDKIWKLTNDTNEENEKLTLTMPIGSQCPAGGNYTTTVELQCNKNQTEPKILNSEEFIAQNCQNTIKIASKYACRTEHFTHWYEKLGVSEYVIGSVLGVAGLFLVFFGNTYFRFTSSVIIAFTAGIMLKSMLGAYLHLELIYFLLIGVVVAFILSFFMKLINTVLAVVIGYFIGNIVYNYIVKIFTGIDPNTLYLITMIVCIVIVIIFCYLVQNIMIIIATSLVGAYTAVRGVSVCLGGFPDETYTSKLIYYKEYNQLERAFGKANLYLLAILCVFVLGLSVQGGVAIFKKKEEKKEDENNKNEDENAKLMEEKGKENAHANAPVEVQT